MPQKETPATIARSAAIRPRTIFNSTAIGVVLIVGVSFLIYFPSLHGGYIFDDDIYLTNAPYIQAPDGLYRIWCTSEAVDYYPVTNTVLWLEWRLWGMNSTGYHLTNLALHIVDCLLIWLLLKKLAIPGAYLAALLLAVHPVNVEAVAWMAQLKELLAAIFFVVSILWYLQADEQAEAIEGALAPWKMGRWYWLSVFAFVMAILSKGSVAIEPLILLVIMWWKRRQIRVSDLVHVAYFLFAVVMIPIIMWFITHGTEDFRRATALERLLGAGTSIWFYLAKAILPVNLIFIYPMWQIQTTSVFWWMPMLAVVVVTLLLWRFGAD